MTSPKKLFAIGDIHGCDLELKALLQKLPLDQNSTLVFLGDYIDRGPNSKGVIEQIIELKTQYKVITLMGNHEHMFLQFLNDPSSTLAGFFILNGGSATLASYLLENNENRYEIPPSHKNFFNSLELYYQTSSHLFVHAGLPDVAINNLDPKKHIEELLWVRRTFYESSFNWQKIIVHGHTPMTEVEILKNRINLDTGCVYNGALSAIEINSGEIYQARPQRDIPDTFLKASPEVSRVAARFSGTIPVFVESQDGYSEFLTVNYNRFGMLILDLSSTEKIFEVGQILKGKIGALNEQQFEFAGQVVRHQKRGEKIAYGIKMLKLSDY